MAGTSHIARPHAPTGNSIIAPVAILAVAMPLLSGVTPGADYQPGNENQTAGPGVTGGPETQEERISDDEAVRAPSEPRRWRVELKRQDTARGTPNETTRTIVRLEALQGGPVSLVRLDLPFPDDNTSFSGRPFNPRLGDIKVRVETGPVEVRTPPPAFLLEVTFPTANPESLGQGKYQVGPGIKTRLPLTAIGIGSSRHMLFFEPLIQQVVSVYGDASRPNINYTKFELPIRDVWRNDHYLKFTVKPVIDWQKGGHTGAVGELEGGLSPHRGWKVTLMLGARLWGASSISNTYGDRVELTVGRTF